MGLDNKHLFATFCKDKIIKNLTDRDLIFRLTKVLRLSVNDNFILFNDQEAAVCQISALSREILSYQKISSIEYSSDKIIRCFLPLLKKNDFEEALYNAVEAGANEIIPMITEKTHKPWPVGSKESLRFNKIIIAAREQAKNFFNVKLHSLIHLKDASIFLNSGINFLFDSNGTSLHKIAASTMPKTGTFNLIFGPEAGLSLSEKAFLTQNYQASEVALTKTILRAKTAVSVGISSFCLKTD